MFISAIYLKILNEFKWQIKKKISLNEYFSKSLINALFVSLLDQSAFLNESLVWFNDKYNIIDTIFICIKLLSKSLKSFLNACAEFRWHVIWYIKKKYWIFIFNSITLKMHQCTINVQMKRIIWACKCYFPKNKNKQFKHFP